jgi:hypothetical protein
MIMMAQNTRMPICLDDMSAPQHQNWLLPGNFSYFRRGMMGWYFTFTIDREDGRRKGGSWKIV